MDVDFAILADGTAQRPDGKMDMFGAGFDTIFAAQTPARHPMMTLVVRLLISRHEAQNDHRIDVIIMHADGQELARVQGQLAAIADGVLAQVPAGRRIGILSVLQFANIEFPTFGPYQVVIHWDGNEARPPISLYLERLQQAPGQLPAPPSPNE